MILTFDSLRADSFPKMFLYSLGGHLGLVFIFTVKALVFPSEDIIFQDSIRVDIVDLPEKRKSKIIEKRANQKKKTKPLRKKTEKMVFKKKSNSKKNLDKKRRRALDRIRASQAIDRIRDEQEVEKETIKGNVLKAGTGDALAPLHQRKFDNYIGILNRHVKEKWRLPQWLAEANLTAQAIIKIDEKGYITKKKIFKSSGNRQYDDFVLAAIEKSSPLPQPPELFLDLVRIDGIRLGFPE